MIPIIMPRQGQSVESCIITRWHRKPGDAVSPGDLLFSYETDKAAFDEEAKEGGTLLAILREEGDDVPVLEAVCLLGEAGEDVSAFAGSPSESEAPAAMPAQPAIGRDQPAPDGVPERTAASGAISPRARALAARTGADLTQAQATGPNGRMIARDVQALVDAGKVITPAAQGLASGVAGTGLGGRICLSDAGAAPLSERTASADVTLEAWEEPLSNIRKRIAGAMHASLQTMAQLTHTVTYDATQVLALRAAYKAQGEAYGMRGVTIGDIIAFAVTRTLLQPEHAALNAHYLGESMRYFREVHLGIAVDTPRGLMVPTLRDASRLSLLGLSEATKALAAACQSGAIDPDLLTGASFTVSNLGAYEIEHFTPVINPPQTGILGVNTIQQRVRETADGLSVYPAMSLSLTYDHRALDGAPASRFLRDLKHNLENIQMLLGGGRYHV